MSDALDDDPGSPEWLRLTENEQDMIMAGFNLTLGVLALTAASEVPDTPLPPPN